MRARAELRVDAVERISRPELEVGCDLVVAAAGRVQLAADVAELLDQRRLDVHVHIFAIEDERQTPVLDLSLDFRQATHNLLAFLDGEKADTWSIRAWATEPWMSCLKSRRSKEMIL